MDLKVLKKKRAWLFHQARRKHNLSMIFGDLAIVAVHVAQL